MVIVKPSRLSYRVIRAAGNAIAVRRSLAGSRLCILSYHRVLAKPDPILASEPDLESFRWQMELLAECFNVMPLYEATVALARKELPARAVCITFDDGYRSLHDLALPILKEFGLPATVFVTSECLGAGTMWNDRIIEAVRSMHTSELNLHAIGLGRHLVRSAADRHQLAHWLVENVKYRGPSERLALAEQIEALCCAKRTTDLMLLPDMVRYLANEGIEIGGHTTSHPILTSLDDASAAREIEDNKRHLEALTGRPVRLFAYPNGKPNIDFDARHVKMVRDAGYVAAFTTSAGAAEQSDDPYQLPRSRPWDGNPFMYGARLLQWLQA